MVVVVGGKGAFLPVRGAMGEGHDVLLHERCVLIGDVFSFLRHRVSGLTSFNKFVLACGAECQRLASPREIASL